MRIFSKPQEAIREIERDLFEMGIDVHPQSMQNKDVANDDDYKTKEISAYGYKLTNYEHNVEDENEVLHYILKEDAIDTANYIEKEHTERWCNEMLNPGTSWEQRKSTWEQFLIETEIDKNKRFHYTYSERFACQIHRIVRELIDKPDTRQAIMTIHSNINTYNQGAGVNIVEPSQDYRFMGGKGRIPCSLHYQFMIREGRLNMIYVMRSCDFLTHFPVDMMLALRAQTKMAKHLSLEVGEFTHFCGSLHAYKKDMVGREIF